MWGSEDDTRSYSIEETEVQPITGCWTHSDSLGT